MSERGSYTSNKPSIVHQSLQKSRKGINNEINSIEYMMKPSSSRTQHKISGSKEPRGIYEGLKTIRDFNCPGCAVKNLGKYY